MDRSNNETLMETDLATDEFEESVAAGGAYQLAMQACAEFSEIDDQHRRLHELLDQHPKVLEDMRRTYELNLIYDARHKVKTKEKNGYVAPIPNPSQRDVREEVKSQAGVLIGQILNMHFSGFGKVKNMKKKQLLTLAADMHSKAKGFEKNGIFLKTLANRLVREDQRVSEAWTDEVAWGLWQKIQSEK